MQSTLTLPPSFPPSLPISLQKIQKNIYFSQIDHKFYKLTILDPLTTFTQNDIISRQNLVLTPYNPCYLALGKLTEKGRMLVKDIDGRMKFEDYEHFVDVEGTEGQQRQMRVNLGKVCEFLGKRIDGILGLIQQRSYGRVVKKFDLKQKAQTQNTQNRKTLFPQLIDILQKDIPQIYIDQLLRTRYQQQRQSKPILLDTYIEQNNHQDNINNNNFKKKNTSKPKPKPAQIVPKNQMTLFQFSGKKESKQSKQSKQIQIQKYNGKTQQKQKTQMSQQQ